MAVEFQKSCLESTTTNTNLVVGHVTLSVKKYDNVNHITESVVMAISPNQSDALFIDFSSDYEKNSLYIADSSSSRSPYSIPSFAYVMKTCYHRHDLDCKMPSLGQQEIQDLLHSWFEYHNLLLLLVFLNQK